MVSLFQMSWAKASITTNRTIKKLVAITVMPGECFVDSAAARLPFKDYRSLLTIGENIMSFEVASDDELLADGRDS